MAKQRPIKSIDAGITQASRAIKRATQMVRAGENNALELRPGYVKQLGLMLNDVGIALNQIKRLLGDNPKGLRVMGRVPTHWKTVENAHRQLKRIVPPQGRDGANRVMFYLEAIEFALAALYKMLVVLARLQ